MATPATGLPPVLQPLSYAFEALTVIVFEPASGGDSERLAWAGSDGKARRRSQGAISGCAHDAKH